jgi:hypothetical protein
MDPAKIGRGEDNVFEPTQFCIKRIYRVQWKKPSINQDELAKLYWNDGLTAKEIAARHGIGLTTVKKSIRRVKLLAKVTGGSK